MSEYILEMRAITKQFPGVRALDNVNFKVRRGEIHCLVGENGAGKSTLMKVLSGIYAHGDYEGDILVDGQEQRFRGIRDSENAGIAIISQELALVPQLTVYENIFFGHEIMRGRFVNWNETIVQATALLRRVKLPVHPDTLVADLRVGSQQLVEIAKTLSKRARIIILDEPTSSLTEEESRNLLGLLRDLKGEGVTIIMISHRLMEVVEIADTITVLRDGASIISMDAGGGKVTEREIIQYMVGRDIDNIYPQREHGRSGEVAFAVSGWTAADPATGRVVLRDINLRVHRGEVVGLSGLMGAGRTELALSLFGNTPGYRIQGGQVLMENRPLQLRSVRDALNAGIAYVSEDRKRNGLMLMQDIAFNVTISNLKAIRRGWALNENEEIVVATDYQRRLTIRAPSIRQQVVNLSGGNQQKVSLAKLLFTQPRLLILDEPTRGIDVGAKYEIYSLINEMAAQGIAIIIISSELPEILGMCDRVYVMSDGAVTGELSREEATEHKIMELATNLQEVAAND